jgi:hypothetical protein
MSKKAATADEKRHMGRVAELGCLICRMPAQIHHVRGHMFGMKDNYRCVPLCDRHHNGGEFGHCVHNGTRTFELNYMTQAEMLRRVNQELGL